MRPQDTAFYQKTDRIFDPASPVLVMGILNITPDSFFDGGKYTLAHQWLERAGKMISEGADIIDIGAYSTRPGALDIPVEEEMARLIPAIVSVKQNFPDVLIAADTFRSSVAEKAVRAGAFIINDISGGTLDKNMFSTVARLQVPYVLMHTKGTPQTMKNLSVYTDLIKEIHDYFSEKIAQLQALNFFKIIIDPGFGFAKTLEHNFRLLNQVGQFKDFGLPVLVGISRKSMATALLNIKPAEALNASTVLNTIAITNGATILRVHDVKEAKEAAVIVGYLKKQVDQ